ncbi:hypothetical protein [Rhodococcus sp. ACS1]|uniref:hypothetical protein n=1 Tax=Rhodococcus sp. ACS1 TaxID=2028570 RepID=UPI0015CCEAEF|nr:hypothetical protein [Rhodococcus sp. ACS1]
MTFRFKSIPIAGVVVATSVLMAACGSHGGESAPPSVGVEATSSVPATPDIPGLLPTADELTALYNTALDYDVPLSDRVNLIQGVDDADPRLAQKFVQEGMTVEFHLVVDRGDGSLLAFGNPVLQGQAQPEGSPIPFVAEDGAWKIARSWACSQGGC